MAATASVILEDIQDWAIDSDLSSTLIYGLIDEVIDDVMSRHDPWFCFNYGQSARTAANHMNDSDLIPPAYEDGTLAVDGNIVSGATVPDNSEYLRAILFPTGLTKPVDVYYGSLSDNVKLAYIGYEEFNERYPPDTAGGGVGTAAHYTLFNGTFLIGPTPPLVTTLSVYGVYRPTRISAGTESNEWITNEAGLIKYGVMRKLILYNFEEDSNRLMVVDKMYRDAKNALYSRGASMNRRVHRVKSRRAGTWRT